MSVVKQMRKLHQRPMPNVEHPEYADDAESVKAALMNLTPIDEFGWDYTLSKHSAFWNRVALHRLRFVGERKRYVVVRTLDLHHRLLVLQVPAPDLSDEDDFAHGTRQMTYHDDEHGRFQPGLRLADSVVDAMTPEEKVVGQQYLDGGFPLNLTEMPEQFRGANYTSYDVEHVEKSWKDLWRQVAAGWMEGPLLYYPHVVNKQGGIWKEEKQKYRPILDCTASGVNEKLIQPVCDFDSIEETIKNIKPNDWLSGFDLSNAFYLWPRLQAHCDLLGLASPPDAETGWPEYYRLRFTAMGLGDSPGIQGTMLRVLMRMCDEAMKRVCDAQAVAAAEPAKCAGGYVDDVKAKHDELYSKTQVDEQFQACIDALDEHRLPDAGPIDSAHKRDWPQHTGHHIGMHIDPRNMYVGITEDRRRGNQEAVKAVLGAVEPRQCTVNRRLWSGALGKLQWTAPVVTGMQAELSSGYAPMYDVCDVEG